MPKPWAKWKEPGFILDAVQALVAGAVGVVLALDMTGIWSGVPWLHDNLTSATLIAVCILIVSAFLERRIKLDGILLRQEELVQAVKQFPTKGITFADRRVLSASLSERIEQARCVNLIGVDLSGIITTHGLVFLEKARTGCRFRFLIVDPTDDAISYAPGYMPVEDGMTERKSRSRVSTRYLEPLIRTGNAELRYINVVPPFSVLAIDPEMPEGQIQVELYAYRVSPTTRPHFVLTRTIDRNWYDFFGEQFERMWEDARPHIVQEKVPTS